MNMGLVFKEESTGVYHAGQGTELWEYDSAAVLHFNYMLGGEKKPSFSSYPSVISAGSF